MKKVQTKNKLKGFFGLFAAFAMAIGVGVSLAPKEAVQAKAADFVPTTTVTSGNKYLITATTGGKTYYLPTGNHSAAPSATLLNLSTVAESQAWTFTGSDSAGYTIKDKDDYILYATNSNNGVRSNKTSEVVWTKSGTTFYPSVNTSRKLALYETQDWRTYTGSNGTQKIDLYELVTQTGPAPESMELDVESLTLDILDSHQLEPSFDPDGATAGVSYSVSSVNPAGAVTVTAAGLVTGLKTGTAIVTATTTDGSNLSATVNVTVTANYSSNIMTPAEAQELAVGADVLVRGKVVADIKNAGSYAIQVGDRGIMTYGINDLTVGHDYIIAAKMAAYQGMPQISNATSVVDMGPSTTTVTPKVINDVSELNAKLSGTLVQINGMGYESGTFSTSAASNVTLKLGANDLAIRATKDVPSAAIDAANAIFTSTGLDDVLNVTTVAGWFNGAQLLFSAETVIQKIVPEFGVLDRIVLNTANVVTSYYVGETFSLSGLVVTAYDETNLAKIVTEETTSSLASGYTFVEGDIGSKTITISYEEEGVEKSETFNITIQAVPAWTTVTLQHSESTTTNFQDGNNASNVGLDSTLFNVVSLKGGQTNHIGMNKDGTLRLYASSGNGSTLEVSIAAGKVISKIEFKFGGTVADAKVLVDDVEKFNAVPTSNGTLTIENISGQKFLIQNVTSSGQLHIKSIDISYENASDPVYDEAKVFADWMMAPARDAEECDLKFIEAFLLWSDLSDGAKNLFTTHVDYADAYLRYQNWAIANGQTIDGESIAPAARATPSKSNNIAAVTTIGIIGLTSIAAYYFIGKKKQA